MDLELDRESWAAVEEEDGKRDDGGEADAEGGLPADDEGEDEGCLVLELLRRDVELVDELNVRALTLLGVAPEARAGNDVLSAVLGLLLLAAVLVARVRVEVDSADGYLDAWDENDDGEAADGVRADVVYDGRRERVVLLLELLSVLL